MTPFSARVRSEGSKPNLCITVPAPIARQLAEAGLRTPGWVRLVVRNHEPVFVYARKPPSRPSVVVTLPAWAFTTMRVGRRINVQVQDATPYRSRVDQTGHRFDWLPLVDTDTYLPTDQGDLLHLHSRHEAPFVLHRFPDPQIVDKLCARGVPTGRDYVVAGRDAMSVEQLLAGLGVPVDRIERKGKLLRVRRSQPLVRLLHAKQNARTS